MAGAGRRRHLSLSWPWPGWRGQDSWVHIFTPVYTEIPLNQTRRAEGISEHQSPGSIPLAAGQHFPSDGRHDQRDPASIQGPV